MTDLNVTAQLEVDDGTGVSRQFSVDDLKVGQTGAAADATLTAGLGADGASAPTIAGTGVRGWLRAIFEKLSGTLTVTGPVTDAQLRATPLPVTGTVTATVDESTLAKDATLTSGGQKTQVTNFPATQPVSGTIAVSNPTANPETGLAKDATLSTLVGGPGSGVATITGGGTGIQGLLRMIWDTLRGSIAVTGTFWQATQPVSAASLPLPAGAAQDGADITSPTAMPAGGAGIRGWLSAIWTKLNGTLAVTGTFWQATQPVSIAAAVTVDRPTSTATLSNVASAATTGTLLAANASRKAFTIFNDSTSMLYVKFGTTASSTSYTVALAAGGYYESPGWNYTGRIDGIWASANGAARVTELS